MPRSLSRVMPVRSLSLACLAALAGACNDGGRQPAADTRPAGEPAVASRPETTPPPQTRAAPAAETRPASRPEDALPQSTFSSEPPYTVQLHVRKPEDRQPGWLRVLELADENTPAVVGGVFPEKNRIEVVTSNVRRLQLELGYLPLAEGKRVVLHIDDQGIEITQRDRKFVILERRPTGSWEVQKPPKE